MIIIESLTGRYDARIRVILYIWATRLFGLKVEHFEMLEDAVIVQVEKGNGAKTAE